MSISESIGQVKKELSGDEQVLVSVFKLEQTYKKYKKIIWGVLIAAAAAILGNTANDVWHETVLEKANDAFLVLQDNPKDEQALQTLKEKNPALFELFSFAEAAKNKDTDALASLSQSSNAIVADASNYTQKTLKNERSDSMLYHELALLESAYLAIKSGDIKQAKANLETIDERSPVGSVATLLKHSILKAK
ncbi:MAG: hypothetical protein IE885_01565 [Campylobacterales bacterium]|nr:hypothetical protein [Campylobacterales bacterium]